MGGRDGGRGGGSLNQRPLTPPPNPQEHFYAYLEHRSELSADIPLLFLKFYRQHFKVSFVGKLG